MEQSNPSGERRNLPFQGGTTTVENMEARLEKLKQLEQTLADCSYCGNASQTGQYCSAGCNLKMLTEDAKFKTRYPHLAHTPVTRRKTVSARSEVRMGVRPQRTAVRAS
jgi:hypothetical protein